MEEKEFLKIGAYIINQDCVIGHGGFGVVFQGSCDKTGENVAAKRIYLNQDIEEYIAEEIEILKLVKDHKNIVKFLYNEKLGREMWIIMEVCDLGNLSEYAVKNHMDLYTKIDIMHQCAKALVYLLNMKPQHIIHRDLKPPNILLVSRNGITAKLMDFGMSKRISSVTKLFSKLGSWHFMAPEMFDSNDKATYNRAVDVFSLAVIIFYLLKVKVVKQLLQRMLEFHPRQRARMEEVEEMLDAIKTGLLSIGANQQDPPKVCKLHSVTLGREAHYHIGFSDTALYLGVKTIWSEKMVKFDILGNKLKNSWKKSLPVGVEFDCYKHMSGGILACSHSESNSTVFLDHNLVHIKSHRGDHGFLRAGLTDGRMLYARKISRENWAIDVYKVSQHDKVATLSRPGGAHKDRWISACCHSRTLWLAVVDAWIAGSPSLDIYDDNYQHQTHLELDYRPFNMNAVACVQDCIVVVDRDNTSLHVYNWAGKELCVWSSQHLRINAAYIKGIGCADGEKLVVAAGPSGVGVTSLHLYDVICKSK